MVCRVVYTPKDLVALCRRWGLAELSVFGSALRDDFGPDSDIDLLVVFGPSAKPDLEGWIQLQAELRDVFGGRPIDLVERRMVTNPFRRHEILTHRQVLYAA